jgi:hypothetical protein
MTLAEILTIVQGEVEAFQAAADKRAYTKARAGSVYDEFIAPIDIPLVPDAVERLVVDPAGRAVFVASAAVLYDAIFKRVSNGQPVGWPTPTPPGAPEPASPGAPDDEEVGPCND